MLQIGTTMSLTCSYSKSVFQKLYNLQVIRNWSSAMHRKVKVQVQQGVLIGQECLTPNGVVFHSFKGIPYSVPPIGELRYKSPIPLDRFEEAELDCTKERDVSHQRDPMTQQVVGSENCLFLNIYAPQSKIPSKPLPVLFYVHGGAYWFGSGNSDYYFPQRFMEEDVIVVTINYRLGALGFLCLPEEGIWGNAGLKDQRLALQWVQENISQFNGDPKNVTLFGESAGAAAVHLHTYADHANKLFHKAIMQSGTANMEWVFQANPVYKAHRMAQLLGYKASENRKILPFLQSEKVTPIGLLANTLAVLTPDEKRRGLPMPFRPVIEDSSSPDKFISRPILEILQTPNTLQIPVIMGYNSSEGMAMTVNAVKKLEQVETDLERFVPRNIPLSLERHQLDIRELASKMRKFYFNGQKIDSDRLNELTDLLSDYHFTVDMQNAAEWQVKLQPNAPVYFYRFDYVGNRNFYKILSQLKHLRGASHGDELFYQFQMANDDNPLQKDDERCSRRLCFLWANFARYGDPTKEAENEVINFEWQPVQKPADPNDNFELDYLAIGKKCEMRKNPDSERIEFWRDIYRNFPPTDYSRLSAKL